MFCHAKKWDQFHNVTYLKPAILMKSTKVEQVPINFYTSLSHQAALSDGIISPLSIRQLIYHYISLAEGLPVHEGTKLFNITLYAAMIAATIVIML